MRRRTAQFLVLSRDERTYGIRMELSGELRPMLGREAAIVHPGSNVRYPVVVSPDRTEQNVPIVVKIRHQGRTEY